MCLATNHFGFYGAGGGGNRAYVVGYTVSYDGRGAGGFLIAVAT